MYAGVDVGGTKVLVAVLDDNGVIKDQVRFPTPGNYSEFLQKLSASVDTFTTKEFRAAGVGIPATLLDRANGRGMTFSNLPWRNVPVQADLKEILHCPVALENDAKLGALSEAMLLKDKFKRVLYITVSTGIGIGLVTNGKINVDVGDGGGRIMFVEHNDKLVPWENVVSGKAIVKKYGKPAHDITDEKTWKAIAHELARGIMELIAITEPEVIVFGGSVGVYFKRFGAYLADDLKQFETPLVKKPVLREASRPEEAVIYGCYDLARATYGSAR